MAADKSYKTSDIYIVAWLLSKGLELQGIDRHDICRCEFILIDRPDRPQLVNQFLCGSATGNVVDFIFYMRRAKKLLYSKEI